LGIMLNVILDKKEKLFELCTEHKVKSLYAFGSVCTDKFNSHSDIDFLAEFENVSLNDYADNYFDFLFSLEDLYERKIDLITPGFFSNPFFISEVEHTKIKIYERQYQDLAA
jgi:predicted nucleotidyltransferase